MSTLCAHQLSFSHAQKVIFTQLNLRIQSGRLTLLLGENGAGKSTLLKLLAGLLSPTQGQVHYGGENIADISRKHWARCCSFMSQHAPAHLDLSVYDIVSMGRYPHLSRFAPLSRKDKKLIAQALEATDLNPLAQRNWQQLSGGEQQRVMLARSLCTQAPILILDEPNASLDLRHRLSLLQHLKQLADKGQTVICSSHDLALSQAYADEIILLHQGRIHAQGKPSAVLSAEHIQQVFAIDATLYPQALAQL